MTKSFQAPDIGTDGGYNVFGPLGDIGYEKSDSWIDFRFLQVLNMNGCGDKDIIQA